MNKFICRVSYCNYPEGQCLEGCDQIYPLMRMLEPPTEQEPVALLHDDGYWTAAKTDAGRRLSERLLFAGSPSIAVYTAPQPRRRLTDEEIDNTTRKQVDDLLDHIYEYGTAAEGIDYRVRAIARAIEAAVWGDGK